MNIATKYVLNLIAILSAMVACLVTIFGWTKFIDAVGGLRSFGGLVSLVMMVVVLIATLTWLMLHSYRNDQGHLDAARFARDIIVACVIMVVLGAIGYNWIDMPSGAGVKVAASIAICAVAALASTWVGRVDEE